MKRDELIRLKVAEKKGEQVYVYKHDIEEVFEAAGFRLVPYEPTKAMIDAGMDAMRYTRLDKGSLRDGFSAMLDAAEETEMKRDEVVDELEAVISDIQACAANSTVCVNTLRRVQEYITNAGADDD